MTRRRRMLEDLEQDIKEHIERETQDKIDRGMSAEEARYAALRKFGNAARVREDAREVWSTVWLENVLQDARFGLRILRKSPGFAVVAVLTLALGIGANTAIFSLIDAVILRSLPAENPSQLVVLKWAARKAPKVHGYMSSGDCVSYLRPGAANPSGCSFSEPMFREIAGANIFSGAAAFASSGRLDLTGNGPPSIIYGQYTSGDFFSTLGVEPALGRVFESNDDSPSAASVAVISYGYWQSAFGGSRDVIGRSIELNGAAFTIVGVAEQRFAGLAPGSDYDIWLPLAEAPRLTVPSRWMNREDDASYWWLTVVGRLMPGMSPSQAQAAVSGMFRNEALHGSAPLFEAGSGMPAAPHDTMAPLTPDDEPSVSLVPAQTGLTGSRTQYVEPLYVLMVTVGIILLIACANVAGLMLARSASRRKEMAVRLALGAGRTRIVRQLLTESVTLSLLGGALGILFAYWGAHTIVAFVSSNQTRPLGFAMGVDVRMLAFTAGISIFTGIIFGIAPAFRGVRVDLTPALKDCSGVARDHGRWFSAGNVLVVAQVALAIVVLVGAGLLVRTLRNLRSIDVGFDAHNVVIFSVDPVHAGYKDTQIDSFLRDLQGRLSEMPGVKSASYSMIPLLRGGSLMTMFHWPGMPEDRRSESLFLPVGPDFFNTMQIPFLMGRDFNGSDYSLSAANVGPTPTSAPTPVIVNQAFVGKYLGEENPLGKHFGASAGENNGDEKPGYEIVGVVRDTKYSTLRQEIDATMYSPQNAVNSLMVSFELRTADDPQALLPGVRHVVAQLNPNLPLFDVTTESEQIDRLLFQERLTARLSTFFGLLALLLACIGLYGLLSHEVARRTREIGIRMALGARASDVQRLVVKQGLILAIVGAAVGISVALGATRYLTSMLYNVRANDPWTIVAVAALLVLVVSAACYIPARRATRVDPMVALRHE
jgi:predicted permease